MARHELADQVVVLLQRAHPGELTKEDLESQSGLGSKELRAVLDSLSEEGELDLLAENYRWRDPSGGDAPPPDESEPESDAPEDDAPLAADFTVASGRARLVLEVAGSFEPAQDDDADAARQAQAIAEQVQNLLGTALAPFGGTVKVRRLEVFDKPRVIFDAEEAEQQADKQ